MSGWFLKFLGMLAVEAAAIAASSGRTIGSPEITGWSLTFFSCSCLECGFAGHFGALVAGLICQLFLEHLILLPWSLLFLAYILLSDDVATLADEG